MYCKTCGESNPDWSNYCSHDGTTLVNSHSLQQLHLVNRENNFCPNCGSETKELDNYCNICGYSLLKFKEAAVEKNISLLTDKQFTKARFFSFSSLPSRNTFKNALIPTIAAFVLMLLLNYITFTSIDNFYNEVFKEATNYSPEDLAHQFAEETGMAVKDPGKLFGFTDSVMMTNMNSPSYEIKLDTNIDYINTSGTGELKISFNYVLFILLPILALFIGGILYRKKYATISINSFLSGSIAIGLIYSLLLSLFSLFSGFHYDLHIVDSGESVNLMINTTYSVFTSLFRGFLIGFVFSLLGMLFSIDFRQMTKQLENLIPFGSAVHQGFVTFTRGLLTLSIIIVIILTSKLNDWKSNLGWVDIPGISQLLEKTTWFATYMGVQLSSMIYSMLHFSPLSFKLNSDGESGGIEYSIFSGFNYFGEVSNTDMYPLESFFAFNDIDLYLKLAFLIPVLLLLFAGYSLAKSNQASFKSLAIFSLVYSLFTASLAVVCTIYIEGLLNVMWESKVTFNFSLAVSTFRVFIGSFILAYITGFAGSYLTKFFLNPRS